MNYIKQLNAFYKLLPNNPLSSNAQCLYNFLLNKNSELGWVKEFTVSNMIVCGFTGLSRRTLDRVRNELKQKGYIDYEKGISSHAGKYVIVEFGTQDVTQNDTQSVTQNDTHNGTQVAHTLATLNKLNINNYLSLLLNNAREKFPPTSFAQKTKARAWAETQPEWKQLSSEEQDCFIANL